MAGLFVVEPLDDPAVIAAAVALVTTVLATPVRYAIDRALQRSKAGIDYEFDRRRELRDTIGHYHGRMLDAALTVHYRLLTLYEAPGDLANRYYLETTVHRFARLLAIAHRFDRDAMYIDQRIAEHTDREFLYFAKAFRWVMVDADLFAGVDGYPRDRELDHLFSDRLRTMCDRFVSGDDYVDLLTFQVALRDDGCEFAPLLRFFDGISPDEARFRWDRLVAFHLIVMTFIASFGYPVQRQALNFAAVTGRLRHDQVRRSLVAWMPKLGLERHAALIEPGAARTVGAGRFARRPQRAVTPAETIAPPR